MEYLIQLITAFLGSLGFAIVFNIKRANILISSLGGFLSWGVYLLVNFLINNDAMSYFVAAVITTLYAEAFARIKKSPATILLICSVVPLIPGGALYYTMRYAFTGEWDMFSKHGLKTLILAASLAFGVIVVSTALKLIIQIIHLSKEKMYRI